MDNPASLMQQERDDRDRSVRGTREEHVEFCKTRAREFLDQNDWLGAWNSFFSDALKHPDTRGNSRLMEIAAEITEGRCRGAGAVRAQIESFT